MTQNEHQLLYPPCLLLFRPDNPPTIQFNGLPPGLIPIQPYETSIHLKMENGKGVTAKRRQLALTGGYAFTDYKAQSQTLCPVLIDPAKPPTARLTSYNAYVALSRSTSRKSIRFLRPFDVSLFTSIPNKDLLDFDMKMEQLASRTDQFLRQTQNLI
jgi:hypothetical protein